MCPPFGPVPKEWINLGYGNVNVIKIELFVQQILSLEDGNP